MVLGVPILKHIRATQKHVHAFKFGWCHKKCNIVQVVNYDYLITYLLIM